MTSLSQQIPPPYTIIEVEALTTRRALEFAMEIGIDQDILEGDSMILIKALESDSSSLAKFGHIAKDVQYRAYVFTDIKFS